MTELSGRLGDRVAVVAGIQEGLREEVVRRITGEGATVVLMDAGAALSDLDDGTVWTLPANFTSPEEMNGAVSEVIAQLGRLDIFVIGTRPLDPSLAEPSEEMEYDRWWSVLDATVTTHFVCMRAVVEHMVERRYGRIISLVPTDAVAGVLSGGTAAYSAGTAAILGLIKQVAIEFGPSGLLANVVVTTRFDPLSIVPGGIQEHPVPRAPLPSEVAGVVAFLASDDAGYITAEAINVTGGSFIAP